MVFTWCLWPHTVILDLKLSSFSIAKNVTKGFTIETYIGKIAGCGKKHMLLKVILNDKPL